MANDLERFLQQAAERLRQKIEQNNPPPRPAAPPARPPVIRDAERGRGPTQIESEEEQVIERVWLRPTRSLGEWAPIHSAASIHDAERKATSISPMNAWKNTCTMFSTTKSLSSVVRPASFRTEFSIRKSVVKFPYADTRPASLSKSCGSPIRLERLSLPARYFAEGSNALCRLDFRVSRIRQNSPDSPSVHGSRIRQNSGLSMIHRSLPTPATPFLKIETRTLNPAQISSIEHPFTQSWIQALTLAASNPLARTIKPSLEWIDRLSMSREDPHRLEAAQALWDFAHSNGLQELIWLLPARATSWMFDRDDIFTFATRLTDEPQRDFQRWTECLGLVPGSFDLVAEVTGSDWAGLVRKEAVRLQHSLDTTAVQQASNLRLPCTAKWDMSRWAVRFAQVDWIVSSYDDPPVAPRPAFAETEESLLWAIASANESLLEKRSAQCPPAQHQPTWRSCAPHLQALHAAFASQAATFSPWMTRVWNCVWPIVYREQNVLNAKADLNHLRAELRDCLAAHPRLVMWMFLYAKLACQLHLGRGLGLLADYSD